jgi:hypothetical protein
MTTHSSPHITTSEVLDNGVIVSFEDGTSIFYPGDLLFSIRDQGKMITASGPDDGKHSDESGPAVS